MPFGLETKTKEKNKSKRRWMSQGEKIQAFKMALIAAISDQMKKMPERFHPIVLDDQDYAITFADHMIGKMRVQNVLVINETVAQALNSLDVPMTVNAAYEFLEFQKPAERIKLPEPVVEAEEEEVEEENHYPRIRGC